MTIIIFFYQEKLKNIPGIEIFSKALGFFLSNVFYDYPFQILRFQTTDDCERNFQSSFVSLMLLPTKQIFTSGKISIKYNKSDLIVQP